MFARSKSRAARLTGGLAVSAVCALAGCDGKSKASKAPSSGDTKAPIANLAANDPAGESVVAALDTTADPCVDFYQFACGGWMDTTEPPPDQPRYGRGFSTIQDGNNETLRSILENAEASGDPALEKAGRFYASCMEEAAVDARGTKPLDPYLARIDAVKSKAKLVELVGAFQKEGLDAGLFGVSLGFDDKNPDLVVATLGQGGTGLPDRSFYLEEAKKPLLDGYQQHIGRMLGFVGIEGEDATKAAADIVAFETELAKAQVPKEELRDPNKTYNPMSSKEIDGKMPTIPFAKYLKALGKPEIDRVIVSTPTFLPGLDAAYKDAELDTLKRYAKWHLLSGSTGMLSTEVQEANFQFMAALTGAKALPPRWKRCTNATTGALGDVVSKAFVERTFPGDSKQIATTMIKDIEAAFEAGLAELTWMDDETRTRAVEKMSAITNKIGYPDKWRSYDGLKVGETHFENAVAASAFNSAYYRDMIGGPTDRDMWFMPSSMVNAYYNPSMNEIVFPAGILQPPFFGHDRPQSLNYGAIGMVMGHELTHGFDDSGRKYDGKGVLSEWWNPEVSTRFEEATVCIGDTYSAIEVQPGTNLNGQLTMGENIADFGGIKQAYRAYQDWTARNGAETPVVDGMTNEQLLFVGYAQAWCSLSTPEIDKLLATVDPHSPPKYRVNVPLAHLPEFWEAYSCGEGTQMHAANACTVW